MVYRRAFRDRLLRSDDDMEPRGEPFYVFFDGIRDGNGFQEILQGHTGFVGRRLLPAAEQNLRFDLVSLGEEFLGLGALELQIVAVRAQSDADSLGFDFLLLGLLLADLLGLLILELSVIKDAADGRLGLRGYLYQIELLLFGEQYGVGYGYGRVVFPVGIDETHERCADLFIDPQPRDNFDFWSRSAKFSPSDMRGLND